VTTPLARREGVYRCRACDSDLFCTGAEFQAGTGGWPNFTEPMTSLSVAVRQRSAGTVTGHEIRCATCSGYHGLLFFDGSGRTSERYCVEWGTVRFVASLVTEVP
jgi:peptide-methionine (R)-S-oxide reductase